MDRRARELADEAAGSYERWRAGYPEKASLSPRQAAEDALARRAEILAGFQAESDALKSAAAEFVGDKELLKKIEARLYAGSDEDLAAMVMAYFLQDEERALDELCRREALFSEMDLNVLDALPKASLERWTTRKDLPSALRYAIFECLGERMGREDDLEGMARTWKNAAPSFTGALDDHPRHAFIGDIVGEWICADPAEAVGRIFNEWPEELRDDFLDLLAGYREARPIWTGGLSAAFQNADWEKVPEDLREEIFGDLAKADDLPEASASPATHHGEAIPAGLTSDGARVHLSERMTDLLESGIDSYDQLADGQMSVEGVARRLAARVPGSERYPAEWAEAVFKEVAGIDPAGALRFAEGKVDPARLEELGDKVLKSLYYSEPRLDRIFEVASLLPVPADFHRGSPLIGEFVVWKELAPEAAAECLLRLPAAHPLRLEIERGLVEKEGGR